MLRQRMSLAVDLSTENVRRGTGRPFGAIVVESETGQLLGAGVNLVTAEGLSLAHAKMVALALAQRAVGHWTAALEQRGIRVTTDVMREDAAHVLCDYAARAGAIYNPGRF